MAQTEIRRADIGLRSERGPVLLSIMLSVALIAIDSTILATAVPAIVRDLGGFAHFPWLFSIYLLTAAVSTPIFAKFSDLHGRKPVMLIGVLAFVVGSILCGAAWNMTTLIIARGVQGLGAGAIQPTAMTITGDLYTLQERAKVQGYLASVWAMSSVIGPTLGGIFADFLSWRWIFFINIPLGGLAAWMLWRRFGEQVKRTEHRIDGAGAVLLALGSSLLIFGLLEGGILWPWLSFPSGAVMVGGVALLIGFVAVERRAAEPIVPGWVFRRRLLVGANLASLAVGILLIGLTSYVPLFSQGVLGTGAVVAGFALAALTLGWPISASLSGRIYLRIGFRRTALIGSLIAGVGAILMVFLSAQSTVWHVAVTCFVVGLGMGLVASPTLVAAQSAVDWESRGVVTGTSMFARSMGSAVGIAVFGAVVNAALGVRVGGNLEVGDVAPAHLAAALHQVFVASAVVALIIALAAAILPRDHPARTGDPG
jgi:EmrB/QacA subfamily drug resistance transporter